MNINTVEITKGSEKQIAWAEKIRTQKIAEAKEIGTQEATWGAEWFATKEDARDIIDFRTKKVTQINQCMCAQEGSMMAMLGVTCPHHDGTEKEEEQTASEPTEKKQEKEMEMSRKCAVCQKVHQRGKGAGYVGARSDAPHKLASTCNTCAAAKRRMSRTRAKASSENVAAQRDRAMYSSMNDQAQRTAFLRAYGPNGTKKCGHCGAKHGFEGWYKNRSARDGVSSVCSTCHSRIMAERREDKAARREYRSMVIDHRIALINQK